MGLRTMNNQREKPDQKPETRNYAMTAALNRPREGPLQAGKAQFEFAGDRPGAQP
jgi:hypothetical protein